MGCIRYHSIACLEGYIWDFVRSIGIHYFVLRTASAVFPTLLCPTQLDFHPSLLSSFSHRDFYHTILALTNADFALIPVVSGARSSAPTRSHALEVKASIRLWKDSPFDLYWFSKYNAPRMVKRVKSLTELIDGHQYLSQDGLAAQLKGGTATREMALLWVVQLENVIHSGDDAATPSIDDAQTLSDEMLHQVTWDCEVLVALRSSVDVDPLGEMKDSERVKRSLVSAS
jgi:hypothetical protein